ncbi:MAG: FKBP-type peptidyl-prolyl cis-trans isomerase [Myxococcota bacterium]
MSDLKNEASYCLGLSIGSSLQSQNLQGLNMEEFVRGVQTVFSGTPAGFTAEEANAKISAFMEAQQAAAYGKNKEAGEAFLAENGKRDGVVTLPSGLQYEVVTAGTGAKPTATTQVTVHYHGTLTDGTVFDSSVQRGSPATFGVNQVIAGWTEALQLMPEGSTWKLFIPQDLAYGASPRPGGPIQPFMALVFEVQLLSMS